MSRVIVHLDESEVRAAICEYVEKRYPSTTAEAVLVHYRVNAYTGPTIRQVDVEVEMN